MSDFIDFELPKMPPRRENRIVAVQFLYSWDINPSENYVIAFEEFLDNFSKPRSFYQFTEQLLDGIFSNLEAIDAQIIENVKNWSFERISRIDLAILRLAIYELLYRKDIPPIVSINEAIELGKFLSEHESKRFINGILDKLKDQLERPLREILE